VKLLFRVAKGTKSLFKIIKYASMHTEPVIIKTPVLSLPVRTPHVNEDYEKVRANCDEMLAQARKALEDAKRQAESCLEEAKTQSEEVRKQAYDEGYRQGQQKGLQQGREDAANEMKSMLEEAVDKSRHMVATAGEEAQNMILDGERQIVELALAISQKILVREIDENSAAVLPIVKAALDKVRDQEQIVIRVNPDDYDMIVQARRDLQMIVGREQALTLTVDHTVGRGGCLIDTPCGTVDAALDTQFDAVKKSLEDVMPS
jgi:flagellar assembly protein FliH